jgi:hypothetical protein
VKNKYKEKHCVLNVIQKSEKKPLENFSRKPRRKIALGRPRRRWRHDNKLGLKKTGWESEDHTHLAI